MVTWFIGETFGRMAAEEAYDCVFSNNRLSPCPMAKERFMIYCDAEEGRFYSQTLKQRRDEGVYVDD